MSVMSHQITIDVNNIREHINQPEVLERLYRKNKSAFTKAFLEAWPELQHFEIAKAWKARIQASQSPVLPGSTQQWSIVFGLIIIAGLIAKIPDFFGWQQEEFIQRNIAFIIFPFMLTQFFIKNRNHLSTFVSILVAYGLLATYINLFYSNFSSDVYLLVCLHIPLITWALIGYYHNDLSLFSVGKWVDFLRQHADILIMSGLLLLSGFLMTAITVGLFEVIGWNLEFFLTHYWLVWALPAIPILAVFFVQQNPDLVQKISPLIARVFTPIVLIMLTGFVVSSFISGKDPFEDRDFLIIFNVVLLGVMALIFFSLADENNSQFKRLNIWIITALATITIVVNVIALSAIIYRISSWGFTPNRTAILGSNLLMLSHLTWVAANLFLFGIRKKSMDDVQHAMIYFLPLYLIWSVLVVFGFPLIFAS